VAGFLDDYARTMGNIESQKRAIRTDPDSYFTAIEQLSRTSPENLTGTDPWAVYVAHLQENTMLGGDLFGSTATSATFDADQYRDWSPKDDPIWEYVPDNVKGKMLDAQSPMQLSIWMAQYKQEQRAQEQIASAGVVQNLVAGFGASFSDPIDLASMLIPGGITGKALTSIAKESRMIAKLMKPAFELGVDAAVTAGARELVIQQRQFERTNEEVFWNFASEVVFGAAMGRGLGFVDDATQKLAQKEIVRMGEAHDVALEVLEESRRIIDERGISFEDTDARSGVVMEVLNGKEDALKFGDTDGVKGAAARGMARITKWMGSPLTTTALSDFDAARLFVYEISDIRVGRKNVPDELVKPALEAVRYRIEGERMAALGQGIEIHAKLKGSKLDRDDFMRLVGEAMSFGDKLPDGLPAAELRAKLTPEDVKAINEVAELLRVEDAKMDKMGRTLGAWSERASTRETAQSYFTRVWDGDKIVARGEAFKALTRAWLSRSEQAPRESLVSRIKENAEGGGRTLVSDGKNTLGVNAEGARSFDIPQDFEIQWLNPATGEIERVRALDFQQTHAGIISLTHTYNTVPKLIAADRFATSAMRKGAAIDAKIDAARTRLDDALKYGDLEEQRAALRDGQRAAVAQALNEVEDVLEGAGLEEMLDEWRTLAPRYMAASDRVWEAQARLADEEWAIAEGVRLAEDVEKGPLSAAQKELNAAERELAKDAREFNAALRIVDRVGGKRATKADIAARLQEAHESIPVVERAMKRIEKLEEKRGPIAAQIDAFELAGEENRGLFEAIKGIERGIEENRKAIRATIEKIEAAERKGDVDVLAARGRRLKEEIKESQALLKDRLAEWKALTGEGELPGLMKQLDEIDAEIDASYAKVSRNQLNQDTLDVWRQVMTDAEPKGRLDKIAYRTVEEMVESNPEWKALRERRRAASTLDVEARIDELAARVAKANELAATVDEAKGAGSKKELKLALAPYRKRVKAAKAEANVSLSRLKEISQVASDELGTKVGKLPKRMKPDEIDADEALAHLDALLEGSDGARRRMYERSVDGWRFITSMKKQRDRLINEATTVKEQKKIAQEYEKVERMMRRAYQRFHYIPPKGAMPEGMVAEGGRWLRELNTWSMMGGVMAASIPDAATGVLWHGLGDWWKGVVPALRQVGDSLKNLPEDELVAMYHGCEMVAPVARLERNIGLDMHDIRPSTHDSKVARARQKAHKTTTALFGLNRWNKWNKIKDAATVQPKMIKAAMGGWQALDSRSRSYFLSNGVNERMLNRFKKMLDTHAQKDVPLEGAKSAYEWANVGEWEDVEAREVWKEFLATTSNATVMTVGSFSLPPAFDTQLGLMLLQFKSFGVEALNRLQVAALSRQDSHVLTGYSSILLFGLMAHIIKSELAGREIEWDNPMSLFRDSIDRSGLLGSFMDVDGILEKLAGQSLMFPGATPLKRYSSRDMVDAVWGPSVGTVQRLGQVASAGVRGLTGETPTQSDLNALRRTLPLQNLFYTRLLMDKVQAAIASNLPERRGQ